MRTSLVAPLALLPLAAAAQAQGDTRWSYTSFGQNNVGSLTDTIGDADADGVPDLALVHKQEQLVEAFSGVDGSSLWSRNTAPAFPLRFDAAGDHDADGFADLVWGGAGSISGTPYAVEVVSGLNGSTMATMVHPYGFFSQWGNAIAWMGDVTGDGVGDFAIGNPHDGFNRVAFHSGASGQMVYEHVGPLDSNTGWWLERSADLDGDFRPDVVAGAPYMDGSGTDTQGGAVVLSGASGAVIRELTAPAGHLNAGFDVAAPGDLDGDGVPDFAASGRSPFGIAWSGADGGVILEYDSGFAVGFGQTSVAALGDVNGDGFAEVALGNGWADNTNGRIWALSVCAADRYGDSSGPNPALSLDWIVGPHENKTDGLLRVSGGTPAGLAALYAFASEASYQQAGVDVLVDPNSAFYGTVLLPLDGAGTFDLPINLGVPGFDGFTMHLQAFELPLGGPGVLGASNGMQLYFRDFLGAGPAACTGLALHALDRLDAASEEPDGR